MWGYREGILMECNLPASMILYLRRIREMIDLQMWKVREILAEDLYEHRHSEEYSSFLMGLF